MIPLQRIIEFVDQLHDEKISCLKKKFFKGVDEKIEIGVSRLISDRVYHLPKLLEKLELNNLKDNSYKLYAQENTSAGVMGLEYFFEASHDEEAQKIAAIFKRKISGVGERLWLASWDIANEAGSWLFEVDTYHLYRKCYPDRVSHPNGKDRKEFFNLIRLLEKPKFFLTRQNKKKTFITFELPILQIYSFDGVVSSNGWPRRLKLQVLPPNAVTDKMAFVATPFHRNTLRLDHNDIHLAAMLQIRRSQCKGSEKMIYSLEDLIRGSGLWITAQTKLAQAKKLLIAKLERLKEMDIIKSYSFKQSINLTDPIIIYFPTRKE